MTIAYSADEEKGTWFGQLRSVESFATLTMIGLCLIATDVFEFGGLFRIGGGVVAAGGIALFSRHDGYRPSVKTGLYCENRTGFTMCYLYWMEVGDRFLRRSQSSH